MIRATGKNVFEVCYKVSNGNFVILGRFRNREVALRADALQEYFRSKYGKTGPSIAKCKSLKKRRAKKPGSKKRITVQDLMVKTISSDGLVITEKLLIKQLNFR